MVTSVNDLAGNTVYRIIFSDGSYVDVKHGTNGNDGKDGQDGKDRQDGKDGQTPAIGVDLFEGVYYWTITLSGSQQWMLDKDGNKIPVTGKDGKDGQDGKDGNDGQDGNDGEDGKDGKDGITPIIGIDDEGYWTVDMQDGDGPVRIKDASGDYVKALGKDGSDASFPYLTSVSYDTQNIIFLFPNGVTIRVPYVKPQFSITFDPSNAVPVENGRQYQIEYTLDGVFNSTNVEVFAQDGFRATVESYFENSGKVTVQAPVEIKVASSRVVVMATNNEGQVASGHIDLFVDALQDGTINIPVRSYIVDRNTLTVAVEIITNSNYTISIPDEAKIWLSVPPTTRAGQLEDKTVIFHLTANLGEQYRVANVDFVNEFNEVKATITIMQKSGSERHLTILTAGTLENYISTDELAEITSLTISGILNALDFQYILKMPNLRFLDLMDISNTLIPQRAFYQSQVTEYFTTGNAGNNR